MSDAISQKNAVSVRSDTVILTDAISQKNVVSARSDVVHFSDVISQFNAVKGLADIAVLSDTITEHNIGLGLADTVIFTDDEAAVKNITAVMQDTVALSDAITERHFVIGLSDVITLADVAWKHLTFGTAFTDVFTVTETISKEPGLFPSDEYGYTDLITIMKLAGSVPYIKPENTVFSEGRIKSVYGMEPSNFYEIDEQGEDE